MSRFGGGLAGRMPDRFGSLRTRLALLYSIVLFALAAVMVGGIYLGLSRALSDEPMSRMARFEQMVATDAADGRLVAPDGQEERPWLVIFESEVNRRALERLRAYSFTALGGLFLGSIAVGWYVAGLVLRPIGRISAVAREITATDLSRRIDLGGPSDELRDLADTFDEMLGRLDESFEGQRRFVQEASHELRNPLAVLRTNLDVVMADPDAGPEGLPGCQPGGRTGRKEDVGAGGRPAPLCTPRAEGQQPRADRPWNGGGRDGRGLRGRGIARRGGVGPRPVHRPGRAG